MDYGHDPADFWLRLVGRFGGRSMVVLGDLAADCFVETRPDRLSREAPVMVLKYERRRYVPGCAANTVMNLRALGAKVLPIGVLGDDEPGRAILEAFRREGVPCEGIAIAGTTTLKVRIVSGDYSRPKQQVLRVDIDPEPLDRGALVLDKVALVKNAEGIVVSDYGYGVATPEIYERLRVSSPDAKLSVDSRHCTGLFPKADLITPNEQEAAEALGRSIESDDQAKEAALDLLRRSGCGAVLLTRGNRGMLLCDGSLQFLPAHGSMDIVDPTGAGDTVVATATLARAAGASYLQAARLACYAAGVKVMKSGPAVVTPGELVEAARNG